ncbi:MAG: T9SS type A sorting domain-containing protein [candidate division Zixibacteria bacterium]|nr:T9SS type A sorting domain-containing protein [candidate division Zixibacteria bacterium]
MVGRNLITGFAKIAGIVILVAIMVSPAFSNVIFVSGEVTGTWSADTVIVADSVNVPSDEMLTIEPGVEVRFLDYFKFEVLDNAVLHAVGTEAEPIMFVPNLEGDRSLGLDFINASNQTILEHCYISDALTSGIHCENSDITVRNCIIENCEAPTGSDGGGGIELLNGSDALIENNIIRNNEAAWEGGGIYSFNSYPSIIGNTIENNIVGYYNNAYGGGISIDNSNAVVLNNLIIGNEAHPSGSFTVHNGRGGGIYIYNSTPQIDNNTIIENLVDQEPQTTAKGGGLWFNASSPGIKNNIVYFNEAPEDPQIGTVNGANPTITYSDVEGSWPGEGNIDADPMFIDPGHGFYSLQWDSPLIDAGDPSGSSDPDGTVADIGAFYFHQGDVVVAMIPINDPINVPVGGQFNYDGILENRTNQQRTVDVWIMLDVPDLGMYGPIKQYNDVSIAANDTIYLSNVTQSIPNYAPQGTYTYYAYTGDYPDNIIGTGFFGFTVTGNSRSTTDSWDVEGWNLDKDDSGSEGELPENAILSEAYPNPFNAQTNIEFTLPASEKVSLEVYNIMGQKVENLINGQMDSGRHSIRWDAASYSSGVYFYKLTVGDQVFSRKVNLIK